MRPVDPDDMLRAESKPTPEALLTLARAFQESRVLLTGAELNLFTLLSKEALTADVLAARLGADLRALTIELHALAAGLRVARRGVLSASRPSDRSRLAPRDEKGASMPPKAKAGPCNPACTSVIKFMTAQSIGANTGVNGWPWQRIDGYRFMNVFVDFEQFDGSEAPVDLGMMFAFDDAATLSAGNFVTFEENIVSPQGVNAILASGRGTWLGSPHNRSSYIARFPVLGPFAMAFAYNRHTAARNVSVWAYLVS